MHEEGSIFVNANAVAWTCKIILMVLDIYDDNGDFNVLLLVSSY